MKCICTSGKLYQDCCGKIPNFNIDEFLYIKKTYPVNKPLYRFLREKSFADDFMNGNIKISTLNHCRRMEVQDGGDINDGSLKVAATINNLSSRDLRENKALNDNLKACGIHMVGSNTNVSFHNFRSSNSISDAFLLCMASEPTKYLKDTFGRYVIKINSPELLFYRIHKIMQVQYRVTTNFKYKEVTYLKDFVYNIFNNSIKEDLGFVKDEALFSEENEYRLLLYSIWKNISPMIINVGNISHLCEKLY